MQFIPKMKANISESCFYDVPAPNYHRELFEFEKNFDYRTIGFWYVANWKICYYFIGVYLVAIFTGQQLMKHRKPFSLRGPLFLWNLGLALFCLVGFVRFLPLLVDRLINDGFHDMMCEPGYQQQRQTIAVWVYWFGWSKIVEFGDTAFIVLRKTPLTFLHWYHHVSVVLFMWGSGAYPSAMQQFFGLANGIVHLIMYSYYALRALKFRIPRAVSITITSLQLLQMMAGVFFAGYSYWAKSQNPDCCVFDQAIAIAAAIYTSYFVLFLNYFIRVYIGNRGTIFDEKGSIKKLA